MRTLLIFLLSFLILPFCLAQTAPSFTNGGVPAGTTYIVSGVAVEEDQLFSLSDILTITDLDVGETMTWSIVTGVNDGNPSNGVLAGFPTIATTNGGDIVPSGLTYQPNLNFTTSDAIRILVSDGTFTRDIIVIFNVTPVNDVPSFTLASDPPASNEDAGQQFIPNFLTDISQGGVGGFDEGSQTVTFDVSPVSSTGNLAFSFISLSSGALNYTAAANTNGTATFNVTASDNGTPIATSAPQTFSITVNAVNDKPTFNVASTSSDEDAGLVTISGFVTDLVLGGTDESGQSITGYAVTQTGQLFDGVSFTTAPSISPTGTLTYQAVPDDNGTVFFSVFATDNGSPAETSDQRGFSIAINPINDPPVFTLNATSATVDEDAGPQLFFPLATRSAGGGNDELSQTTSFSVTQISTTGNLTFATTPNSTDLTNTGSFNYEPTPNTNGSATFEIVITDNGTPVESSAPRTITINVTAVNDPPVFTIAANPAAIDEDAGLQTIAGFATAIGVGGGTDESVQSITSFSLTEMASTENLTFAQAPAISTTGELTYQATANTNGTATFDVTLSDDGSPAATNATQTFTITVNAVNDVPTFTIEGNPGASDEDAGLQTVTGFATAISAGGGSDEATQALTFGLTETASTGTLTFSTAPAISSDGELTFQAAPNTNGTANFEVTLSDDGSPVATSGVQAFTITVNAVNDVPSFTINDDPNATEEDAGLQTFGEFANAISAGGGIDESGQSLTFSLNETASTGTLTFSSAPAISLTGVLTYEAAANTNGSATFNVTLSDNGSPVGTSPIQTFTITVFDVNDVPSFTLAADPAATNEDAGLQTVLDFVTDISPGGGTDELSQPLEFNLIPVSTTGNLTFSGAPAISPTGVLTYQAQSNSNGTATFELTLSDLVLSSDGLLPDRTSASQAFTITANSVNDVPTFTTEGNPGASDEDAGFQTVTGFATAINPGGGSDESTQALTFSLTETSTSGILAFSSAPALSSTGVLTYEAAANTNGSATFNVTLSDNGSPVGTSPIQTFTITVFGVNDVPSFTLAADPAATNEDAVLQTVAGFVTDISPGGGADESSQPLRFNLTPISTTGNLTFSSAPSVSAAGELTYQAETNTNGTATFELTLSDLVLSSDGLLPDRTSAPQVFTITVNAVNDVPTFTIEGNPGASDEDAGLQTVTGFASAINPGGGSDESTQALTFSLTQISASGTLVFSSAPVISSTGVLTYEAAANTNGSATFNVTLTDNGSPVGTSPIQTFTITVFDINDVPSFTLAADPAATNEDAVLQTVARFVTDISPGGGADESSQPLRFNLTPISTTGNLTFSSAPSVSAAGELTYQAETNTNGTATFELTLSDLVLSSDGLLPDRTSASQALTITVNAVNDVPTFTIAGNPGASDEDAGLQTVSGFATAISAGGGSDETTQVLTFGLTETASTGTLTFSTAPAISSDGELTFQAAPNTNGTATFEVTLSDDGSPVATSGVQAFTITVNAVNDVPSFTINDDPNATEEDAGVQTLGEFANAISPGGGIDESGQSLTFSLTETAASGTLAFSIAPAISSAGELTYQAAPNTNGIATFDVMLIDDGSPVQTSGIQSFTITINAVNDVPSFTINNDPNATNEDAGLQTFGEFANAISAGGGIDESGQSLTFSLNETASTGTLTFSSAPALSSTGELTYQAAPNTNGTATFDVNLSDDGSPVATSGAQAFTITINAVNDEPSFTINDDPSATEEDAGLQIFGEFANAISAGGGIDESGQSLTFSLTETATTGTLAFSNSPTISSAGELTFQAAPNTNGTTTFDVTLSDDGSPVATSGVQSFTITVGDVNDPPSFIISRNPAQVEEDAGRQRVSGFASAISAGAGADESSQTLTFSVRTRGTTGDLAFESLPSISRSGELSFEPSPNTNGTATFDVALSDGLTSTSAQSFTIAVNPVNDMPEFTIAANPDPIAEDSEAQIIADYVTGISAGGGTDEEDQALSFTVNSVSITGTLAFSSAPAISPAGELTYTPLPNTSGIATFEIKLSDGFATTAPQSMTITVDAVNDTPEFILAENGVAIAEDSGAQKIVNFATAISAGDEAEDSVQVVTFNISNITTTGSLAFSSVPVISPSGELTFTTAANTNGTATFDVTLSDDGTSMATSNAQSTTITVGAVNDTPNFELMTNPDQSVAQNSTAILVSDFATNITPGDGEDEAQQALTFETLNDNNLLFSVQPAIDARSGSLTYTIAPNVTGVATVSTRLSDDSDGANTSPIQTFQITVNAQNNAPTFTKGADVAVSEDAGQVQIDNWATNISDGDDGSQVLTFQIADNSNPGLFSVAPALSTNGTLTFTLAENEFGLAEISVLLTDDASVNAQSSVSIFSIIVDPVNDAPVIKAPSDLTEDAGSTQAIGLTGIGTGATNEQQQMVITVTTDRPDLITNIGVDYLSPSEEGTLTFDIIGNSDAVATITVTITDVPSDGESALETVYTFAVQINRVVDNTIFLPSLFSPNSDGQNDRFVLRGNGIADITLSIQDTEGFEVYRTDNVMGATQDGWDGNYSNGSRAHSDSYIWVLRGSFSDGSPLSINGKRTGIVRLIR